MKTTKYESIHLKYNSNEVNFIHINESDLQRFIMYTKDGDTLFFLDNSLYMDYREYQASVSYPHILIYSEGQL